MLVISSVISSPSADAIKPSLCLAALLLILVRVLWWSCFFNRYTAASQLFNSPVPWFRNNRLYVSVDWRCPTFSEMFCQAFIFQGCTLFRFVPNRSAYFSWVVLWLYCVIGKLAEAHEELDLRPHIAASCASRQQQHELRVNLVQRGGEMLISGRWRRFPTCWTQKWSSLYNHKWLNEREGATAIHKRYKTILFILRNDLLAPVARQNRS